MASFASAKVSASAVNPDVPLSLISREARTKPPSAPYGLLSLAGTMRSYGLCAVRFGSNRPTGFCDPASEGASAA